MKDRILLQCQWLAANAKSFFTKNEKAELRGSYFTVEDQAT